MEIEKKFLIQTMPDNLEQMEKKEIEQGYLCTDPVVRIRKSNESYILTYKSRLKDSENHADVHINREVEMPLTKEGYLHLREKADNHMIAKNRYLVTLDGGYTAELDIFKEQLEGLLLVEVEFKDEESANKFCPPDWFGEDVSLDRRYTNGYLSTIDSYNF